MSGTIRPYLRLFSALMGMVSLVLALYHYDDDAKCTKYAVWAIYFGMMAGA